MPITTKLNTAPFYDDYNEAKKYYRILFVGGNAVQARELTQMQTMLQAQVERFGNNIFKEGDIVEGCTFTELNNLKYIKVIDGINPELYVERVEFDALDKPVEYWYELEGSTSGLRAFVVSAARGFATDGVDLNTFFINYLNTNEVNGVEHKEFIAGETLLIREFKLIQQELNDEVIETTIDNGIVSSTNVALVPDNAGNSIGLTVTSGIIYQRGHFLLSDEQTIILRKYHKTGDTDLEGNPLPHNLSVGFMVDEAIITAQQDPSLFDNSNGSPNENAPGASRLMLTPVLTAMTNAEADEVADFFALRRYANGVAVTTRDVSTYNVIGSELARRTNEESGDYHVSQLRVNTTRRANGDLGVKLGPNTFYSNGYRVENPVDRFFKIDEIVARDTTNSSLVTFDYGGYLEINDTAVGPVTLNTMQPISLVNASGAIIGYTFVKNIDKDRIFIFPPRMLNATTDMSAITGVRSGVAEPIVPVNPAMYETSKNSLIFRLPATGVSGTANYVLPVRTMKTGLSVADNKIVIPAIAGETFTAESLVHIFVTVNGIAANVTSASHTQSALTVNLDVATGNAIAYYNVMQRPGAPKTKQLGEYFIKTQAVTNKKVYSLGVSDVKDIVSITDQNGNDLKPSFSFHSNQNDNFYDHSYIKLIEGRTAPASGTILVIKFRAFVADTSGSIAHFFTADSYVDVNLVDIPSHRMADGSVVSLADCLDFRPIRAPGVSMSTTEVNASTYNGDLAPAANAALFPAVAYITPPDDVTGYVDIETYASRVDVLAINSFGEIYIEKGVESKTPIIPSVGSGTAIANIYVPTIASLTQQEAIAEQRADREVRISTVIAPRSTMRDIQNLRETVNDLREYVALSLLEKNANDMLIVDQDGLNRFKSGILVDNFTSFGVADVADPEFKAAIDTNKAILTPAFDHYQVDLSVSGSEGATIHNGTLALLGSAADTVFIEQNKATSYRTCTSNFYYFKGNGSLSPAYDAGYDTVTTPNISINIDLASSFSSLVSNLQQFVPLSTTATQILGSTTSVQAITSGNTVTQTQTTTTNVRNTSSTLTTGSQSVNAGGVSYLSDFQFEPFIRSREVKIYMAGLRPNTRHYFVFDTVMVNEYVAPGVIGANGTVDSIGRIGNFGDAVRTNANGEVFAVFRIPGETFYVGDRVLRVVDVDDLDSIESASASRGDLTYRAYNFTATKGSFGINVDEPTFGISTVTTNNTVVDRQVSVWSMTEPSEPGGGDNGGDPLAQTFYVKKGSGGSPEVYVNKLDLFFRRKSAINGVTVMIREVENGYPSAKILPYGSAHLTPSQVNVSQDATAMTRVVFQAPVRLETDKEYCFVIMPDANDPDYLVFTAKVGENNIGNNLPVNQDWGEGVLFTSTNNRAWQSYQGEDVKFTLHRIVFNSGAVGKVQMNASRAEFLEIGTTTGMFNNGERVFAAETTSLVGSVIAGSFTVTVAPSQFAVGDAILYSQNGDNIVTTVTGVDIVAGTITVKDPALESGTIAISRTVSGVVRQFDIRKPGIVVLDESTASDENSFEVGDTLIGVESNAQAVVTSIKDMTVSTMRPMLNRRVGGLCKVDGVYKTVQADNPQGPVKTSTLSFVDAVPFKTTGSIIPSRSNGVEAANKPCVELSLSSGYIDNFASPAVDVRNAALYMYEYITPSNYVSKVATLEDGFDASDFNLFVTAYRPAGTDVKAYIRVKNANDYNAISENSWIELEKTSRGNVWSSLYDETDYKEVSYAIPQANKVLQDLDYVVQYANSFGRFQRFKQFQVRLELVSPDSRVYPMVKNYSGIALR